MTAQPEPARDERAADGPPTGLDRLVAWLLPGLFADARSCDPCIDHDHQAAKSEPELEAGL
jgi:hypothetical protein